MALRIAVLKHMRVAVNPAGSVAFRTLGWGPWSNAMRWMSSETFLDKDEVTERVLSVVKSFPKVDPSKVTPSVNFQKDLGLDSLDTVEIVMALEEEFALEIPDKEADKIDSCSLAIDYISAHPMAK
ncbi:acyl carrier protein 1, mitochondrial [Cryptomeria japonica]|uniref:acyl carrier protein 1, mitochondrial n=1 Tax=Cryptomeria japonica TaxID=3369 RepID=UPI0025AD5139|nr:acyl carrier protein 1, mitochondrial [Cryptomeria japonica]